MKINKWNPPILCFLFVLLMATRMLFPVVTIKFTRHALQIIDDSSGQSFEAFCKGCHSASAKLKGDLAKPYDNQSKLNHQQKHFKEKRLILSGASKYYLEKDIYLVMEGMHIVLVNGREGYKWTFAEDAVILVDDQGRPAFIQTLNPINKAKIPLLAAPLKK
jgi:hypothetical protein